MAEEKKRRLKESEEPETLDTVNARILRKRKTGEAIKRLMEADIEAKSKRKRSREVPASAKFEV